MADILRYVTEFGITSHTVYNRNVAQRIYFSAMYDLWWYSQRLL